MQAGLFGEAHRVSCGGEGVPKAAQRDPIGPLAWPRCSRAVRRGEPSTATFVNPERKKIHSPLKLWDRQHGAAPGTAAAMTSHPMRVAVTPVRASQMRPRHAPAYRTGCQFPKSTAPGVRSRPPQPESCQRRSWGVQGLPADVLTVVCTRCRKTLARPWHPTRASRPTYARPATCWPTSTGPAPRTGPRRRSTDASSTSEALVSGSEPDQLHRPITARDPRLQTSTTPCVA